MSQPIYTLLIVDKENNEIVVKEFDDEKDAHTFIQNYPNRASDPFSPETWDIEWSIVFGVELSSGTKQRLGR